VEICGELEKKKLRIVFFGTPEFAAFSLEKLLTTDHEIVAVVTAPDKPAGRGLKLQTTAVKKVAEANALYILQPKNLKDASFQNEIRELKADLGIVIAFRMLPEAVWSTPALGTFNLHASLLPQYRGAAPINHAIINGETETGITTFFLKHEIDTGDIIKQKRVAILDEEDAGSLHDKLMKNGAELVLETLEEIATSSWKETPQPGNMPLKSAPKLNRHFCELQVELDRISMHNKIRGLCPYPGAWIKSEFGELKIYKSRISDLPGGPGTITIQQGKVFLKCADGYLEVEELQPAGKPRMDAKSFVNGQANKS